MRSPRLAALELRRFGRGRLPRAALVALLLLPLLYGALYLWSFWDPYGRLDRLPVALVNEDRGATAEGERIAAGDDIVDGLHDSDTFQWHEVSAAEARRGVEKGTYYLSLTVPADFSRRVASASGDAPETGALRVRTNDANNYVVGQISRTVFSEIRSAASAKTSRSYLDKIFLSFSDIHDSTRKAAKGADDLHGGLGTAKKGAGDLADGLTDAEDGSGELAAGLDRLDRGAGSLASGAGRVEKGARSVAGGTRRLADTVNGLAEDVRPFLKDHGKEIGDTARLVAGASKKAGERLDRLPQRASKAAADARTAAGTLDGVHRARCEEAGEPDPPCPELKRAAEAAGTAADAAGRVDRLVRDNTEGLKRLSGDLGDLHGLALDLADRAPRLAEDLDGAVKKINALDEGAHKVAAGAGTVAKGAGTVRTGVGTAEDGADELDAGIGELHAGADTLDGGMYKLVDGSGELAGGLHDGAGKIPDYGERERDRRTEVMADPVQLASRSMHAAPNYGTGFAPYFIPLSLWVGAMVAYMLVQPLNRRALAAGAPSWRIAFAGWLPVAALGVLQAAALMAVLHWGLGLHLARAAGTFGFLVLVTACFTAIVQWLGARFGPAGRLLVLALLMLQLTSAGGTYPVQTSPGFFNALHPFLPMTYVVEGLRRLITGGGLEPVWQGSVVLAAFTAGALALTAWSARRRQVWTLDRLRPELSL